MSLFNRGVATLAVLGVLGVGFLGYVNRELRTAVVEARAETQSARQEVKIARGSAARAIIFAKDMQVKKDSAEARAKVQASAGNFKSAYEEQKKATASLQAAVDTLIPKLEQLSSASGRLDDSSGRLVKASKGSFWDHVVPKVGVGGAVGINPAGRPDAVIGLTLSWQL